MGCSVRFAGCPGCAEDRPIERFTGQHCSVHGKSKRKTGRFESAGEIGPVTLRPRACNCSGQVAAQEIDPIPPIESRRVLLAVFVIDFTQIVRPKIDSPQRRGRRLSCDIWDFV
jgi:hypothetical protein